jgi:hypothetical protein
MAIILEAVAANGAVQRVQLADGATAVPAQPGLRYRLLNDAGGRVSQAALVKRVDGDLVIEGLPGDQSLSLQGFFTRCTPQAPCSMSMDNIGGTPDETVTPATQPVAALPEGGFLMYASGMTASAAAPPRESEFSFKPLLGIAGGVAILGAAGGGGGGSKSSSSDTTPPGAPTITSGEYTSNARPVFTGTAEPGSTLTMTLDVGSNNTSDVTYTTRVATDGSWVIDTASAVPATGSLPALAEGVPTAILARATDPAGNIGAETRATVTLDATPPPVPEFSGPLLFNVTTPVIRGTAEPGVTVRVELDFDRNGTFDATYVTRANATAPGSWQVDLATPPTEGTIPGGALAGVSLTDVRVTAVDAAGNPSPGSLLGVLDIDTNRPPPPTINSVTGDNDIDSIEAQSAVTITGTLPGAEAGQPVSVTWGGLTLPASVTGTTWSITFAPGQIPPDGAETVSATYIGIERGTESTPASVTVSIDRVVPTAPTLTLTAGSNSGDLGDTITSDDTPTIRVTLAGAGPAAPVAGDTVRLSSGATLVGTAVLNASNVSAGFVDITTATLGGDGSKTLTATVTDAAGNVSDPSGALALTIDRTPPATPTVNAQVTNDTTPAITGTAVVGAGEALTVTVNGITYSVGADLVRAGNNWTLNVPAPNALPQGSYSVVATVSDAAGNATSDASSNELLVDTTLPGTPTLSLTAGSNSGDPGDTITNDDTPTIRVTLAGAGPAAPVAGDTVRLSSGATLVGTAVLNASNVSAGFVDITTTPLGADGPKSLTATVSDAAGNVSDPSGALALTIDRTLPAAPTVNAQVTNDTTPAITGTAVVGAGEALTVTVNGVTYPVGADLVRAGNNWTLTVPAALPQGSYSVVATVTDAAGNATSDASSNELLVDTTPPGTPTISLVAGDDRVNEDEADAGVAVVGTAEANSTVTVTWGSTDKVVTADGAGNWSTNFTDAQLPADGSTTISASAEDAAGNTGATGSRDVAIDRVDPTAVLQSAEVLDDDPGPAVGVPPGGTTDDVTPILQLTLNDVLAAGETLRVYRDGLAVGEATNSGATVYAYPDALPGAGTYVYTADIVDLAGNVSTLPLNYSITVI